MVSIPLIVMANPNLVMPLQPEFMANPELVMSLQSEFMARRKLVMALSVVHGNSRISHATPV